MISLVGTSDMENWSGAWTLCILPFTTSCMFVPCPCGCWKDCAISAENNIVELKFERVRSQWTRHSITLRQSYTTPRKWCTCSVEAPCTCWSLRTWSKSNIRLRTSVALNCKVTHFACVEWLPLSCNSLWFANWVVTTGEFLGQMWRLACLHFEGRACLTVSRGHTRGKSPWTLRPCIGRHSLVSSRNSDLHEEADK